MENEIKQEPEEITIEPQDGPQYAFLATEADIAFYGGAAGSGKTFALLLDPLRHYDNGEARGVFFRRTMPEIKMPGGLWDSANNLYRQLGAYPANFNMTFPSGFRLQFAGMEKEDDCYAWQGSAIPWIGFDEVTHFTEKQFFYMVSRNRSDAGVKSCIRGACNPDPDSWLRRFVDWWIGEDGYPIPERSGVLRHYIREDDGSLIWKDEPFMIGDRESRSVTFISALIEDNKIFMAKDPGYLANLNSMSYVERMQLRHGNWNIRAVAGNLFRKEWFEIVDALPANTKAVRYWDRAATEPSPANPDPDWTVGLIMHKAPNGQFFISNVIRFRGTPMKVETAVKNTATQDRRETKIGIEQDPGSAGVSEADSYVKLLAGFDVQVNRVSTDKVTRAKPLSAQAERGNIKLIKGDWNETFLNELEPFPDKRVKDDQVDAASGAFTLLTNENVGEFSEKFIPRTREPRRQNQW